jgi:hypothetical protein
MSVIDFKIPFSGFNSLTFPNILASLHMYIQGIAGVDEYDCSARDGKGCNGCGNCNSSASKIQEDYYFLFDTMSGRSSERPTFDGATLGLDNTPETVDFLLKFAGYEYKIITSNFVEVIEKSISVNVPVVARVKNDSHGAFRIITGSDESGFIIAPPTGAQKAPAEPVSEDELAELIIITGKCAPKLGLLDGLKKIRAVMEYNRENDIWGGCISRLKYWDHKLADVDFSELERLSKRLCDNAWYNFNCHNFAETFRHRITDELRDKRLDEVCRVIDAAYDGSHTRNWQLIALHDCRDWSNRRYNELEWGMCECAILCLEKLREYDATVLSAVSDAIIMLGGV